MSDVPALRIVPGAPPPSALSKNHKKKHKSKLHSSSELASAIQTPSSNAQSHPELFQNGGLSGQGTPISSSTPQLASPSNPLQKLSPVIDLVTKRLKATQKKILRIKTYASTADEKLNDDQRRTLQTLPSLELVARELEEVKKAIEIVESDLAREETIRREAAEEGQKFRVSQAVLESKAGTIDHISLLLTFLRLRPLLDTLHPVLHSLNLTDTEVRAICSATDILLGEGSSSKDELLVGFLSGEGEFQGISYPRFLDIARTYLNPPSDPSLNPPEPLTITTTEDCTPVGEAEPDVSIVEAPSVGTNTGSSLLFMQESELDTEGNTIEGEPDQEPQKLEEDGESAQVAFISEENVVAGDVIDDPVITSSSVPIDWAADEHSELPEISGLHARFGSEVTAEPTDEPPTVNNADEDDGFSQSRDSRARGRGFRGDRGRGGGFRGGERSGERGGFRGYRGGERGAYRGDRGGFRGDGGFRGRGDGEYRGRGEGFHRRGGGEGEYRGRGDGYQRRGSGIDGEYRGRGRGRGRGEERGGPPS